MFSLNKTTGEIIIPQGDTALFKIKLKCKPLPEDTVAIFGICKESKKTGKLTSEFAKVFDVVDNSVIVRLANQDTRDIDVGTYYWDLRIVTDPEKDEDGNVRCDDPGDNVYSIFSGGIGMPKLCVMGVAADI